MRSIPTRVALSVALAATALALTAYLAVGSPLGRGVTDNISLRGRHNYWRLPGSWREVVAGEGVC